MAYNMMWFFRRICENQCNQLITSQGIICLQKKVLYNGRRPAYNAPPLPRELRGEREFRHVAPPADSFGVLRQHNLGKRLLLYGLGFISNLGIISLDGWVWIYD